MHTILTQNYMAEKEVHTIHFPDCRLFRSKSHLSQNRPSGRTISSFAVRRRDMMASPARSHSSLIVRTLNKHSHPSFTCCSSSAPSPLCVGDQHSASHHLWPGGSQVIGLATVP